MRVLVGRPREAGERTALRLAARGHEAELAPLFDVVALPFRAPGEPPDALAVTSGQAVPAAVSLGLRVPVFAVGDRTAAALRAGGIVDVRSAEGDGHDLARLAAASLRPGSRLLHLAGRDRGPEPAASLRRAGLEVAVLEVYAAEAVAELPAAVRARLRAGAIDAALHYSPRGAAHARALAAGAGLAGAFGRLRHACLSAAVAEALGPDLAREAAVASAPSEDALLAALERVPLAPARPAG